MTLAALADQIAKARAAADAMFTAALESMRAEYGKTVVNKALNLASARAAQREVVSISASRARHRRDRAAEQQTQAGFREQRHEPSTQHHSGVSLPPGWR